MIRSSELRFLTPDYLAHGNDRQRRAHRILSELDLFRRLHRTVRAE